VSSLHNEWQRLARLVAGERLPAALVRLEALESNAARLFAPVRAARKNMRLASKSLRCPAIVARVAALGHDVVNGLMTYSAEETAFWAADGARLVADSAASDFTRDLLLAYPTVNRRDCDALAAANKSAHAAVVADDAAQLPPLAEAARAAGVTIPVVIDVDMSWRPLAGAMHLGVRRSPLRDPDAVAELARTIAGTRGLAFDGIMGYEAQLAGLTDAGPFAAWQNPVKRALKAGSRADIVKLRRLAIAALLREGLPPRTVNGGGTGSIDWSSEDASLTELTAGSGFLAGHLFSYYAGLALEPALVFALQVTRRPAANVVTCHGGGFIASGQPGADRLPLPWLPEGCALLPLEAAGEVQTPVTVDGKTNLAIGDPIFFRPAKSGEPAEHFAEYLLVRGDAVEARAPTYRGLGKTFIG
jgi:D-serine deaminase-like pyridoxal phosphate-dependent protein